MKRGGPWGPRGPNYAGFEKHVERLLGRRELIWRQPPRAREGRRTAPRVNAVRREVSISASTWLAGFQNSGMISQDGSHCFGDIREVIHNQVYSGVRHLSTSSRQRSGRVPEDLRTTVNK